MEMRGVILWLLLVGVQYNSIATRADDNDSSQGELVEAMNCLKNTIANLTGAIQELRNEVKESKDKADENCNASLVEKPPTTQVTFPPLTQEECPPRNPQSLCDCGGCCGWRRVAYLNMSDNRYTCPAGWHTQTTSPCRGCGRTSYAGLTCDSAFFPVSGSYSQICGVVQGCQVGFTEAFRASNENQSLTIDNAYVTGVSITQGNPRNHIWTYAAGQYESRFSNPRLSFCPCDHINNRLFVPQFVGACYHCESGNNAPSFRDTGSRIYSDDILWDGEGCAYPHTCCDHDGALCFSRAFDASMSGPIEMRICNFGTAQQCNVVITHLELYVK